MTDTQLRSHERIPAARRRQVTPAEAASFLARVALFAPLGEQELQAVGAACRSRTFKAGQVLFHEGDAGQMLYVLRSGRVKMVLTAPHGAETLLYIYGPGDYMGELALLDEEPRAATAIALEQTEALTLYRDDFLALLESYPQLAQVALRRLSGMVRRLNRQIQSGLMLATRGRLAQALLELAEQHGEVSAEGVRIPLRLTQQDLAEMVGGARSNVSSYLTWFQKRGILTAAREGIVIHKPRELRKRIV